VAAASHALQPALVGAGELHHRLQGSPLVLAVFLVLFLLLVAAGAAGAAAAVGAAAEGSLELLLGLSFFDRAAFVALFSVGS